MAAQLALESGDLLVLEEGDNLLTEPVTSSSVTTLPSMRARGTNAATFGEARLSLPFLSGFAASGYMRPSGTSTLSLPSLALTASNLVRLTLPSLSMAASGALQPQGTATIGLPKLTASIGSSNLRPGALRVELRSYHGTSPVGSNVMGSLVSMKWARLPNQGQDFDYTLSAAEDALLIPEIGEAERYTLVKNMRIHVVASAPFWIGNFRVWFAPRSRDWNGTHIYIRTADEYQPALSLSPSPLSGFTNNIGSYTRNNPLVIPGYFYAPDVGVLSDWIQIQGRITPFAEPGIPAPIEIHLEWDEWQQL